MATAGIFLSHTTADDAIVAQIRESLEGQSLTVWVDSRDITAGDDLNETILMKIKQAAQFMVVLSPMVINSAWVGKEIKHALKVQKGRADAYKVIPILLDGVEPSALHLWFGENEPLAVRIGDSGRASATAVCPPANSRAQAAPMPLPAAVTMPTDRSAKLLARFTHQIRCRQRPRTRAAATTVRSITRDRRYTTGLRGSTAAGAPDRR